METLCRYDTLDVLWMQRVAGHYRRARMCRHRAERWGAARATPRTVYPREPLVVYKAVNLALPACVQGQNT